MKNKKSNKHDEKIKKYPIFYQDKEYEIRIEEFCGISGMLTDTYYVRIYEVKKSYNKFRKEKTKYNRVFDDFLNNVTVESHAFKTEEDYYIKIFNTAFKMYLEHCQEELKKEELKNKQLMALQNWNGVIKL